jgi:hypothetical protein
VGRVEEAYLLVDTPAEHVQAVLYEVAGVALSDLWHVLVVDLLSLKALTVNFVNTLLRHARVVATVHEQLSLVYHRRMAPPLAGIACPARSLRPL